jgi:hypothetical protein
MKINQRLSFGVAFFVSEKFCDIPRVFDVRFVFERYKLGTYLYLQ